jgi:hypothetical protein
LPACASTNMTISGLTRRPTAAWLAPLRGPSPCALPAATRIVRPLSTSYFSFRFLADRILKSVGADLGIDWTPTPAARLSLTGYYSRLDDLIQLTFAQSAVTLRQ